MIGFLGITIARTDYHKSTSSATPVQGSPMVLWTYKIRRTKFAMVITPRLGSDARQRTNSIPVVSQPWRTADNGGNCSVVQKTIISLEAVARMGETTYFAL